MTNEEILNLNAFSTPQPTDAKQPIQQVNKTVPFPSFSDTNGPSSFLGKVGADAKLLGQVPGIIGSKMWNNPLQTAAGIGVGAVGGFLLGGPVGAIAGGFAGGMVGATGVKESIVGAGESLKDIVNPQYYMDHPLLAAVNTLTWASLPADAASLHIINPVIDGSVTAGVDAAIGAGVDVASAVPEQTLRAVIKKSLSDGSIGEVIKSGDSAAVKDAVIKGLNGIKVLTKDQITTIADGVEQSVVGGVSKINPTVFKGIDLVAHPLKTFLSKPIGAIGKAVFGDLSPNSAMARVFGMKAVSSNPDFFAQAEDYMTRSAEAEGYGTGVDAVENYVRKVLIDDGSFLKNKSGVAEDFIHKMTQYANAEGVTNRMTQIGSDVFEGKQIVPGKVLRPVDIEAITKTIEKMSPDDFTGLSTGQIANKVLKNFDITDFKQAELADLINKNGRTLNGIIESVKELTGPALVPEDILNSNPELLKLANQMKDTGYSPVYAPTKKPVTLLNEPGAVVPDTAFSKSLQTNDSSPLAQEAPGTVYHGTKAPITDITQSDVLQYGDPGALYGQGTYLTDSKAIAEGYAKTKGKGDVGKVLQGVLKPDVKLLDLEKPLGVNEAKAFGDAEKVIIKNFDLNGEPTDFSKMTGKEAYKAFRETLAAAELPKYEAADYIDGLQQYLKEQGYQGFKHIGGIRGGEPSNISIIFPNAEGVFPKEVLSNQAVKTTPAREIPPLDIQFKQTALGNLIDKIGLSARNVPDQLLQKLYQQQLGKLAVDTFGEGTIDLGSRVVPVDKLYDQLNVIRGIKGKTSVNMLTAGDLKSLGVESGTASKIIDVIKKSNMLPVNYTGIGPAITNFAKAYIPGYNSFLNATLWGHFGLGPEYGVIAAFKDNVLSIFGGGKIELPQENSIVTSSVASKLADWIRKVPGSDELFFPKNTNADIANYRQYILGKTGPSDLQDAMDSGEMIDWTNANDLQKGTESYNLGQKLLGYSRQNTEIAFAKNMASKYGIELKDLGKYPGIADDIANTVRDQFHYRPGLETSPLMRTLNTIVYPIRFEAKVASRTMEWLAKQNPIIRGELITQITAGTNFLQSPEGKQYVKKNAGLLMALEYLTPYNEIGTTIEAATKGDLFGGNLGYIGGLPAGFIVNILQGLGLTPKTTQKDEFTGKNYPLRSVPKKIVSGATVEVVLENLLQHMFPTSLYNITGGVIPSVITMVRPKIQAADKGALKKQFKKVPANYNILNRLNQ